MGGISASWSSSSSGVWIPITAGARKRGLAAAFRTKIGLSPPASPPGSLKLPGSGLSGTGIDSQMCGH
jgi:hypothetical protein